MGPRPLSGWPVLAGKLGLVTRITFALAPRPERVAVLFFGIAQDTALESAVSCVRDWLRESGAVMGNLNLMNPTRMEAMAHGLGAGRAAALTGGGKLPAWTGATAIYGSAALVNAVAAESRRRLRRTASWVRVVDPAQVERLHTMLGRLPRRILPGVRDRIARLRPGRQALSGVPSDVALRLAYSSGRPCQILWRPIPPATVAA